ncbi:ABC transporter substrate-binding protein [Sinanaerobacter chloroacetimidivorans]|uniref:ABC transporter substrate-binding protein n=1 Tax=Sinanaerobacter chloroacetimidivorans TaxID=2818044 RepID=A0A8J8B053_9FIRM|nr:ABC transporter substrate-binding protein [Sinanaerobacter chloroacetimidivorans]MBR0596497.1 ABC transporter substrate-binding protein [Sinanaerobacter chloroacetimidivorans]
MRNKSFLSFILVMILVFSLTNCGGGNEKASDTEQATLNVVNWKDYGSDNSEFVAAFEEAYNCKIVNQYMSSEEDLLTKLRTSKPGEIDVCLPNCTILTAAIEEGLLKEIDPGKLKNFDVMFERFKTQKEVMKDGKYFAVPFVWGSTAIAYNTDEIKEPPTSMKALFDEKYAGKIAFRDDYNDAVMAAAIVTGQDPNNPTDLDAIKETLLAQKKLNRTYWKTGDEFSKLFAGGQITIGMMWSGQAASMKQEGQPISFVVPEDGAIGWVDNWGIVEGTENEDLAYAFIDWMISKDFQYSWAAGGGPAPVNQEAAEAINPDYAASAGMDENSLNRLFFMEYRSNEVKQQWNELWTEVKATN